MAHHDNPGHIGIRTKTHKLIFYYGVDYDGGNATPPGWELYDLVNDPTEIVNLYDDPEYKTVADQLKVRLAALRKRVGDDGSHFPATESVVEDFWDYNASDRLAAEVISHQFLKLKTGAAPGRKIQ